jgi:hypothetical protein
LSPDGGGGGSTGEEKKEEEEKEEVEEEEDNRFYDACLVDGPDEAKGLGPECLVFRPIPTAEERPWLRNGTSVRCPFLLF